jgi:hypothetical protein
MEFSDAVLVLDDGSTDGSDRIAWRLGCDVRRWTGETMWGTESPARAELWDWAAREAGDGWVLIADADMLLHGDPRPLTLSTQCNAWSWVLYDCWNEERYYRCDGFWRGHEFPRPWLFKPGAMECDPPIWGGRGIHAGHCPANATLRAGIVQPDRLYWLHLAYTTSQARIKKKAQYLEKRHLLSPFELAHAESIGD